MNLALRSVLVVLVIGAALVGGCRHTPHHDMGDPFQTLYMHLMPAPLVWDNHKQPHAETPDNAILAIPLPEALDLFGRDLHEDHHPAEAGGAAGEESDGAELSATAAGTHATKYLTLNNLQVGQFAAIALCFLFFLGLPGAIRRGRGDILTRIFSGWAMWIRDEMVYPVMGKEMGRSFLPYFLCVFFFLAFINLMGLLPGSFTATASIFVTAGMALTTLFLMVGGGMVVQGPLAFWKNLVPHVPLALWPLMFLVELIGLLVKPFALTVRLFANMSGGHMVVLSFMGLIFYFGETLGAGMTYGAVAPAAVAFGVFIMIIETFVALLQAYIFTQLSILFIGASLHPEH